MPSTLTYPGVYIEEIPSGVRTITGVATSITAFVGRALRGPVNEAVVINGYGDYERVFGGLWLLSSMSYAVRDFFLNGGGQAVIVRLFAPTAAEATAAATAAQTAATTAANAVANAAANAVTNAIATTTAADIATAARGAVTGAPGSVENTAGDTVASAAEDAAAAPAATLQDVADAAQGAVADAVTDAGNAATVTTKARLAAGGTGTGTTQLNLEAASEGAWGNSLRAHIDYAVKDPTVNLDLFNLSVKDMATGVTEVHRNVSFQSTSPRYVDKVLANESRLVRMRNVALTARPTANAPGTDGIVAAGTDPFTFVDTVPNPDVPYFSAVAAADAASDGRELLGTDYVPTVGGEADKLGIYALLKADLFNLLCLPPPDPAGDLPASVIPFAAALCERERAMLLIDPPNGAKRVDTAITQIAAINPVSKNAAVYFPRLRQANPLRDNQMEEFVPCGAVAGVIARTDATRGVWKAPAGLDATLSGVPDLAVQLTDAENGQLNPLGINCLRAMPAVGRVVWGARTTKGDDRLADEWKYIPVRRTALYIEESLYRGTQWVVFEPNDEPLWAQIRLNVGAFMQNMFRQGAFQGRSPKEAYFVKCDKETTTQNDINLGIVNIIVGFAPLKPAEFVVIKLQQMAGQIEV
ncbi:MAG TPA: phage tail sheath subtilisin-like domain-containing protein [Pyrinomonadaceae bacterium]